MAEPNIVRKAEDEDDEVDKLYDQNKDDLLDLLRSPFWVDILRKHGLFTETYALYKKLIDHWGDLYLHELQKNEE